MSILYSLVAKDGVVLGEYTSRAGNFQTVTRLLLPRIPTDNERVSYVYDEHVFHHFFRNGLCFMAMCPKSTSLRLPYTFLQDVADLVFGLFPVEALSTFVALSLNNRLAPLLQERMLYWNEYFARAPPELSRIHEQIANIQDVLVDNIDKLLARKEKIGLLVDRTEQLHQDAIEFTRQAGRYQRRVWWQHYRLVLTLGLIVMALFLIASMAACGGPTFPSCRIPTVA